VEGAAAGGTSQARSHQQAAGKKKAEREEKGKERGVMHGAKARRYDVRCDDD
jgi:hypothetical protein